VWEALGLGKLGYPLHFFCTHVADHCYSTRFIGCATTVLFLSLLLDKPVRYFVYFLSSEVAEVKCNHLTSIMSRDDKIDFYY